VTPDGSILIEGITLSKLSNQDSIWWDYCCCCYCCCWSSNVISVWDVRRSIMCEKCCSKRAI